MPVLVCRVSGQAVHDCGTQPSTARKAMHMHATADWHMLDLAHEPQPGPPDAIACIAMCAATSDDEQAVSTDMDAPVKPYRYDRRPLATDSAPPVAL